jgi:hypothetical protein
MSRYMIGSLTVHRGPRLIPGQFPGSPELELDVVSAVRIVTTPLELNRGETTPPRAEVTKRHR